MPDISVEKFDEFHYGVPFTKFDNFVLNSPLLVDLFLISYESMFLQTLVKNKKIKEDKFLISLSDILMMFFP